MSGSIGSDRSRAIGLSLLLVALASLLSVGTKLVLRDVPAFTFVWLQLLFGMLALGGYALVFDRQSLPRAIGGRAWGHLIAVGLLQFVLVRGLFLMGLERLPVTTHVYVVNFVGFVTLFLGAVFLRERPTAGQCLGAGVALVGLVTFFRGAPRPELGSGLALVGVGVLCLASANVVGRSLARSQVRGLSSLLAARTSVWIGATPVVVVGVLLDWPPPVEGVLAWTVVISSGVVSIAFGMTVWHYVLETLQAFEFSLLGGSSVIFTALIAYFVLGETMHRYEWAGIGLMFAGLVLVAYRQLLRPSTS